MDPKIETIMGKSPGTGLFRNILRSLRNPFPHALVHGQNPKQDKKSGRAPLVRQKVFVSSWLRFNLRGTAIFGVRLGAKYLDWVT